MIYIYLFLMTLSLNLINFKVYKHDYLFSTPFFVINASIYKIISLFILIVTIISFIVILRKNNMDLKALSKKYIFLLILNILLYIIFNVFVFKIVSPFFAFTVKITTFLASLYLHEETIIEDEKSAKLLLPYILWSFYLTLSYLSIFIVNNS